MKRQRSTARAGSRKTGTSQSKTALLKEIAELRSHLEEMQETLHAIRAGEVDALFLDGQVYSLQGAETPYRILVESMYEGAATLSVEGTILYCNQRLGVLLGIPLNVLIGSRLRHHVHPSGWEAFDELIAGGRDQLRKGECVFLSGEGETRSIQCSISPLGNDQAGTLCLVATDLTDRRLAENARFGSLLASIGDAVIATDQNGMVSFMNGVAEKLTGWTLAEAAMKPAAEVFTVISEQTRMPVVSPILQVLQTGKPARLEEHALLMGRDGSEVPVDDSAAPVIDSNGKMIGVVLVFRDVTGRRERDRAFAESQAMLRAVINGVSDPIYMKDRESRLVMVNPATLEAVGKPLDSIIGKTDLDFYDDPAVGRAILENDRRIIETGQPEVFEETIETPHGYRSMLSSKTPWRDLDGKIIGILGVSRDITERRNMEEEVRRSESEYRLLFEFNPQPMWMVDKETFRFVAVNEAALAQYGYTREEFLRLTLFDIVQPDQHLHLRRILSEQWHQVHHPGIFSHFRKDGTVIKVEVISRDVVYDRRVVRLTQGQDVTRRIQAEEALRENLKLFQAFVESSLEPSLMIDEKGTILAASQPGIDLLCSSHEDLVGQNVLRYIPSEQLPILEKSYDTLLKEPLRPRSAIVRMRLLDGTMVWVEAVCSMLRVDDRIGGYIVGLKRLQVGVLENARSS